MSRESYERSMELAKKCRFYTVAGGRTAEEIQRAESLLGIKFSAQYRDFNEKYGYLSFYGNEIFGADPEHPGEMEGNCVGYALNDRREYGLPEHFIPIYNYDDGYMAYLDYSCRNEEGEPRIVMLAYNGTEYVMTEVLADDFGDFVLSLVLQELEG